MSTNFAKLRQIGIPERILGLSEQATQDDVASQAQPEEASEKVPVAVQLDFWPPHERGIPNEIVRSALFSVVNQKSRRRMLENVPVYVLGDGEITYTGSELRQDDEDVWLQILHLARPHPLGEWVVFRPATVLKSLGWARTSFYYKKLSNTLSRLQATALKVHSKRLGRTVSVSLVRRFDTVEEEGRRKQWRVWLEPEIRELFGKVYYTRVTWAQRQQLSSYVGKWLHGLYSSHAEPFPMKVKSIRDGCGSATADLKHFRPLLIKALEELKEVGFLESWHIDETDKVHVVRAPRPVVKARRKK